MKPSISQKLTTLFTCCAFLLTMIIFALWYINKEQLDTKQQFNNMTNIHRGVDLLRSQLWSLLQFNDEPSLERVLVAQRELDNMLHKHIISDANLATLKRLNQNLLQLIEFERDLSKSQQSTINNLLQAQTFIHARYNIIMEDMTETLLYEQKQLIKRKSQLQTQSLWKISTILVLFTFVICFITYRVLNRFRAGVRVLNRGIGKVADGDLTSRIIFPSSDAEFESIISGFNQMKASLQKSTITRKELEYEVEKQTKILKDQKDRLKFLSDRDPLTKLLNRRAMNLKIEQSLAQARRMQTQCALIFFDVDNFKQINDTKGHPCGDEILIQVAKRLSLWLTEDEICGRFGGDEFVALLNVDKGIETLPTRLNQLIERLRQPIHFSNELLTIHVSIGVAIFPDEEQYAGPLLQCADSAMYMAKHIAGSHFHGNCISTKITNNVHKL